MKRIIDPTPFRTVGELADFLGVTRATLYERVKQGWKIKDVISKRKQANQWAEYAPKELSTD